MVQRLFYSYEDCRHDMDAIGSMLLRGEGDRTYSIVALPRGGLIPAVFLSHRTGYPMIEYAHILQEDREPITTNRLLLVDDIADSGASLHAALTTISASLGIGDCPEIIIPITIHYKQRSLLTPSIYVHTIADDAWIDYFWELPPSEEIGDVMAVPDYQLRLSKDS